MTEPAADRKLEGHKKMIDIQYEVEGEEEWLGVETIFEAGECIESYSERDLYFYESSPKGSRRCTLRQAVSPSSSPKTSIARSAEELVAAGSFAKPS